MRSTTKHVQVAASFVLVGASVMAANPVVTAPPALLAHPEVQLTANSIANIPVNVINAIASLPANEILAINQLATSLNESGSWFTWNPRHVEGWDYYDTLKLTALVNVLLPIPAVANALAAQLNGIALAEIPWNAGCTGIPGPCDDPLALYGGYFQVPLSELLAGYTFDEDLTNPIGGAPAEWAGETFQLDPLAPLRAGLEALTATPTGVQTVDLETVVNTIPRLAASLVVAFNPLTPGSVFYGPPYPVPLDSTEFTWLDAIFGALSGDEAEGIRGVDDGVLRTAGVAEEEGATQPVKPDVAIDSDDIESNPLLQLGARVPDLSPRPHSAGFGLVNLDGDDIGSDDEVDNVAPESLSADTESTPETAPEEDADAAPGRHRVGTPFQSIVERVTGAGTHQASEDASPRRGLAGAVESATDRLTPRTPSSTGGEDRRADTTTDGDE